MYVYTFYFKFLVGNGFQRALDFSGAMLKYPGFRSISSIYCYSSVSYGQKMTTLFKQFTRMTVNLNAGG